MNVVVLSPEQLSEVIGKAVREALAQLPQAGAREVLSLQEAADFLGRHPKVVTKLVRESGLPAHYISDREPRFLRSELVAWLQSRPVKEPES